VHRVLKERRFHISVRCATLMQSLCEQEAGPDGVAPLKTSHDQADILASPIDALRYALWAAAHGGRPQGSIRSGAEVGA
jgi:hypothetical protein